MSTPFRRLRLVLPFVTVLTGVPGAAFAQRLTPYVVRRQAPAAPVAGVSEQARAAQMKDETTGALFAICRYLSLTKPEDDTKGLTDLVEKFGDKFGGAPIQTVSGQNPSWSITIRAANGTTAAWAIGTCAELTTAEGLASIDPTKLADNHGRLVGLEFALSRYHTWLGKWRTTHTTREPDVTEAMERESAQRDKVAAEMRKHDLLNPFSAAFFAGTAIGGSGRLIGTAGEKEIRNRISEREATTQLTKLTLESAHFGWEGEHRMDASFRAQVGFQPTLTVLSATSGAQGADGKPVEPATVAVLQTAFVSSVGARAGVPIDKIESELSLVGTMGAGRPTADAVTFDDKKPALNATLPKEDASRTAWFAETGVEFAMFDNPVRVLHVEKGLVTPAVIVAGGYRYDARFSNGELPRLAASPHRLYFRFMIDTVKTVSRRGVAESPKAFDLGFGLEYERNMKGSSVVPSTTRFIIRGNINLLKAADNNEKEKDADAAKAPNPSANPQGALPPTAAGGNNGNSQTPGGI